jgi:hypothetical protein
MEGMSLFEIVQAALTGPFNTFLHTALPPPAALCDFDPYLLSLLIILKYFFHYSI